jgi:hypothetical protein
VSLGLVILSLSSPAPAAEYAYEISMSEMLDGAEQVVNGRVEDTKTEWGDDGLIYTVVTLQSEDTLHHSNAPDVTFRVPGGTVGDLSLTIPGAPVFSVGQDVVVFLDGDRLRGFGQGAFLVEAGLAKRDLGNALEIDAPALPVKSLLGDVEAAQSCLRDQTLAAYEDGWSLRGSAMARVGADDAEGFTVTMIEGLEYRVSLCADQHSEGLEFIVFDEYGRDLAGVETSGRGAEVRFTPPHTGNYTFAIYNGGLVVDTWRTSVGFAITYR